MAFDDSLRYFSKGLSAPHFMGLTLVPRSGIVIERDEVKAQSRAERDRRTFYEPIRILSRKQGFRVRDDKENF